MVYLCDTESLPRQLFRTLLLWSWSSSSVDSTCFDMFSGWMRSELGKVFAFCFFGCWSHKYSDCEKEKKKKNKKNWEKPESRWCARGKRRMFFNSQKRGSPLLWSNLLEYSCSFSLVSPEVLRRVGQHAGDQMAGSDGTCCLAGGCSALSQRLGRRPSQPTSLPTLLQMFVRLRCCTGRALNASLLQLLQLRALGCSCQLVGWNITKTSSRYHIAKQGWQVRGVSTNWSWFSGQPVQLSVVVYLLLTSHLRVTVEHLKYCIILAARLPPFLLPSLLSLNDILFSQFLCCSSVVSGWKIILFFFFFF